MTDGRRINVIAWLAITLVVLVLDQWTKHLVVAMIPFQERIEVIPFFNLTHVYNYGAAFSFLSEQSGWQRWFLSGVSLIVSLVILVWLFRLKTHQKLLTMALVLVLGGALGNLYDRIMYGYVVDFIDWYYGSYHWPAFNLADAAISMGAVLLVVDTFMHPVTDKAVND